MNDTGADLTTWQQLGALVVSLLGGLGIGRASKREQIVEAIQKMEHTMETQLGALRSDIKLLLDRGERR